MIKLKMPHTFTIVSVLTVIIAMLTWVLPAGVFERVIDPETGRSLVVAGTYTLADSNPQGMYGILTSFIRGIIDSADIIAYLLVVGGSYGVILKTKALDQFFEYLTYKLGDKTFLLIPIIMILFSIAGSSTGYWEETLPFYLIIVPLMIKAGYDALVGGGMIIIGAGTGVIASVVNPFATGIASSIAEITLEEGMIYRIIAWFACTLVSIAYVLYYAYRVKKDPKNSLLYNELEEHKKIFLEENADNVENKEVVFNWRSKLIVTIFFGSLSFLVYGLGVLGWWIEEASIMFLSLAIICAILHKINETEFWECFMEGAKNFLIAALIIGLARGIVLVAQDGNIIDTILNSMANFLSGLSREAFVILGQFTQTAIGFLISSSSGHASLTIPIMAPLADLFEVPRYAVVTSMHFASGFANLLTPTSGVLMAALSMCRIKWGTWVRFVFPLVVIHMTITSIILYISI